MKVLLVNELRIGNLLYNDNVIVKIDARSVFDIWDDKGIKTYKPILLTEEWLLNFGFEKSNRLDLGELKHCYAIFSLAIMIRHNSFFIDWIGGNTELKYVHQLQNIYFGLCGKELTLNKTNDK